MYFISDVFSVSEETLMSLFLSEESGGVEVTAQSASSTPNCVLMFFSL